MLALSLEKNKKFKYRDLKLSKKINKKKCRIKIKYSGICSSDIPRAFENKSYFYPIILGHEFSGVVKEVGRNVKKFKLGDKVTAFPLLPKKKINSYLKKKGKYNLCENYSYLGSRENGAFCEYLDVNEWNLYKIKKGLDLKLASIQEPTAVAFNVVDKIENNKKNILIIGAGFISQIILRILFRKKLKVTILDRNKFKLKIASKFAEKNIFYNMENKKNNLNLNKKFDCIIDSIGSPNSLNLCLKNLKPEGKFIVYGNIYRDTKLLKNNYNLILRKELSIQGVLNSTFKIFNSNWSNAEKFLIKYSKDFIQLITHETPLKKSKELFQKIYLSKIKKKKIKYIKGIIKM